jgi:secreted PhoX family phosphatase
MQTERHENETYVGYEEIDQCSNPAVVRPIGEIINLRVSRRSVIKSLAAAGAGALLGTLPAPRATLARASASNPSTLTFEELEHGYDQYAHVAPGYEMQVLLRWGDPVATDSPPFDVRHQTAEAQQQQFGYNCDFIAFMPLPRGSKNATRGLLCVNHEYTDTNLMFPGITSRESIENLSREQVEIEMAAHGHSVVEIQKAGSVWRPVDGGPYNRRISTLRTITRVSGLAAGHQRLKTAEDITGTRVLGTLNNCAGGVTPWGTMLICEENFDAYFSGDPAKTSEARNHKRYGINGPSKFSPAWAKHHERFDIEQHPHEPNRFGWVVEFDPYDPASVPTKRTALGRLKHEGAGIVLNPDGRVVIYCGDDERFDYVYKFVTSARYNPDDRDANRDLLDDGTLHVAQFHEDGTLQWLPLVYGQGKLTAENGFQSQADVLIEARRAADLLGATPMDRPEDIEPSPTNGRVYVILSNNSKRDAARVDAANPRANNAHGHIIEMIPPGGAGAPDHAALKYQWNALLRAGNPRNPADDASYHPQVSDNGWLTCPDNATFDQQGRMWITTDNGADEKTLADGVYGCDVEGAGRALTKLFFSGPRGSEVSGVCLTPDDTTMFVSVQHPGEEPGSDFAKPTTRWPDFRSGTPPRPAVVAITKRDGGKIGS